MDCISQFFEKYHDVNKKQQESSLLSLKISDRNAVNFFKKPISKRCDITIKYIRYYIQYPRQYTKDILEIQQQIIQVCKYDKVGY